MNITLKCILSVFFLSCMCFTQGAEAHVVVKPNQVGVGAFQTFTIGVPVEKDSATVALRLVIPQGLQYVTPNVKPGWTISTKKSGEADKAVVTEIDWTGGSIPVGQRDEFLFSAKVPTSESVVQWKAYQTYADGTIVSWDQSPAIINTNFATSGPYSETKVINDLGKDVPTGKSRDTVSLVISICALVIALTAVRNTKRKA